MFVSIELEEFHVRYLDIKTDGNSVDMFVGPVSDDGRIWTADWINVFDYGPDMPQDRNDMYGGTIIFRKVPEKNRLSQ